MYEYENVNERISGYKNMYFVFCNIIIIIEAKCKNIA